MRSRLDLLQYVQTVLLPSINAQPETLFLVRMQPGMIRVTPGFYTSETFFTPEQPNPASDAVRENGPLSSVPSNPGLTVVATCEINLGIQLVTRGLSLERYCARIVFARHRSAAFLPKRGLSLNVIELVFDSRSLKLIGLSRRTTFG